MSEAISWFADIGLADRPTVGGKGGSLGELTQMGIGAGIDVPPGFVVRTEAFEAFVRKHRLHCKHIWVPKKRHVLKPTDPADARCVKCGEE